MIAFNVILVLILVYAYFRLRVSRNGKGRLWYRAVYLRSRHWQEIRGRKLAQVGHACEICHRDNRLLDVHHLTYERLGHERLSDLQVLCRKCHDQEHKG